MHAPYLDSAVVRACLALPAWPRAASPADRLGGRRPRPARPVPVRAVLERPIQGLPTPWRALNQALAVELWLREVSGEGVPDNRPGR